MAPALSFAIQVLNLLPGLIQAGIEVASLIQTTATALKAMHDEGRDPTDAEWEALHAATEASLARLDSVSS